MKKFLLLLFFLLSISFNSSAFIRDSEIENTIKEIVGPIAEVANQDKEKLKIFIINDKQLNAFVTPGQKIFIFSGLIIVFFYTIYIQSELYIIGIIAVIISSITEHVTPTKFDNLTIPLSAGISMGLLKLL